MFPEVVLQIDIGIIRDHSNFIEIVLPDWDRAETKSLEIWY